MYFQNWHRPKVTRMGQGEYAVHERGGSRGGRDRPPDRVQDRVEIPPRMARLIQKAQALEEYIPDLLAHPDDDPEYAPELKLYHRLNCHKTVLVLLGQLSLKEAKDLGNGEEEALELSDKPFSAYPYFTLEDTRRLYPSTTPEEAEEWLAGPYDDWHDMVEHQVHDFVDDQVSRAGVPCVVQVGRKDSGGNIHLQHSFVALKTKGGRLVVFGKEGFTDPSMSRSYGDKERRDEQYAEAKFQFGELREVWKYHKQYVSRDSEWRIIPFNEIAGRTHPGFKHF